MSSPFSGFHKVFEHVRLPLLSPYFLHDCVEKQSIISQSKECRGLIEEAKTFHLLTDRRSELRSPRTRPRKASGELILLSHIYTSNYQGWCQVQYLVLSK